jgi:hypothetical protein
MGQHAAAALAASVPQEAWQRLSAGGGAKGELSTPERRYIGVPQ